MEWISVEDRLPCSYVYDDEKNGPAQYLVHVKNAVFATVGHFLDGKFIPLESNVTWGDEIDYWAEMPEPPKAKEKSNEVSIEILKELKAIRKHLEYVNKGAKFL